jgi:hypothetical protein
MFDNRDLLNNGGMGSFTGVSAFDQHRVDFACVDPAQRGLVEVVKTHWSGWGWPDENASGIAHPLAG